MRNYNDANNGCFTTVVAVAMLLAVLMLTSCKSKEHIIYNDRIEWVHDTIETSVFDSIVIEKVYYTRDSIYFRDSIATNTDSNGNVTTDRWHWYYAYQGESARIKAMELEINTLKQRKDSIVYVDRCEKIEIEKPIPIGRKADIFITGLLFGYLFLFFIGIYMRRKKSQ